MLVFKIILILSKLLASSKIANLTRTWNATTASLGQFPFAVALLDNEEYIHCTGSLISKSLILTAAHCVGHIVFALAGDIVINAKSNSKQIRNVTHTVKHPSHTKDAFSCDLALAFVSHPFVLNKFVKVIHLCDNNASPGEYCMNAGWSSVEDDSEVYFPNKLVSYNLRILRTKECPLKLFYKDIICASAKMIGPSVGCSGGPLIYRRKLCGVVSARMLNSNGGYLFANVVRSKEWILSNGTKGGTQPIHIGKLYEPKVILLNSVMLFVNYLLDNL